MALTTRHAAALAAEGLPFGLISGYLASGLYVLCHARRALRLASQYHSCLFEVERMVREKDAARAAPRAARPPIILDGYGALGAIPSLADRMARPTSVPALTPTALDPTCAYNPLPACGEAPDARTNP